MANETVVVNTSTLSLVNCLDVHLRGGSSRLSFLSTSLSDVYLVFMKISSSYIRKKLGEVYSYILFFTPNFLTQLKYIIHSLIP